jgi:serine/threonine protein kinase/Tol biopolymer transport system component
MDLSRWPNADEILDHALERPPAERRAYVREAAAGDSELLAALEAVLFEADTDDGFLAPGGGVAGAIAADLAAAEDEDRCPRLELGTSFGAYLVEEVIGQGGMGEVYRVRDTRLGRDVALKVLPRRFAADPVKHARFDREARLLASLNHPHIASIYDVEEHDGVVALVLELVDGPTLADEIVVGRVSLERALVIATEIGEALAAAHARGIVHRDLKPSNIKLTAGGDVKVLDFGIAKALAPEARDGERGPSLPTASITREQGQAGVMGTAPYVSPEHARGLATDHRSDIWAFGCVIYELLTGMRAFDGESTTEIIARVLERDPDFSRLPAETPPALRRLVERSLRKDPARRIGYIGDALLELEDARKELTAEPPTSLRRPRSRRAMFSAGAVALAAGLIAGAALTGWRLQPRSEPAFLAVPVAEVDDLVAGEAPGLAISPDGQTVVYRAWRDGVIQLVRRSLVTGVAEPVPGSEDTAGPFFSPDGQWIGFSTQSEIMKVAVNGNQPQAVTPSAGGARASWGVTEAIVFSADAGRGIYVVPASGGEPRLVATPDSSSGHLSYESPDALPTGRHALVTIRLADRQQVGIVDFESGSVTALADGRQPRYSPTGHIVFARENALWAVPFDLGTAALGGDPLPIVDDLERGALNGTSHFDVSDDGNLVYMPGRRALDLRTPVWISPDGEETVVPVESRAYTRATLSPDASRIALAEANPENRDIWIYEIARGTLMRLTTDPATDTAPIWSPDGRRIAFRSERDGGGLFLVAADGAGTVSRLTSAVGPGRPAHTPYAFTPDGRSLLFTELRSYADQGIAVVHLEDTPRTEMLLDGPFAETRPALSPDGAWLAYQSDETGRYEIYVRPYPDINRSRTQVSTRGGTSARWRADGQGIVFHDGNAMMMVPVTPGEPFVVGEPAMIFEASRYSERLGPLYDITPDGQRFLFLREGGPSGEADRRDDLRLIQRWTGLLR